MATATSASTPATNTSANRSPPVNHDDPSALTEAASEASGCDRLEYAPALPADAPRPVDAPPPPCRGAALEPRPPVLPGAARPPPLATPLAVVAEEEEEEDEEEREELDEDEPLALPFEPVPDPPLGPFSSVPPMIAWAPAPGPP